MALYQPTNVIPSSYTKGTVDAVKDNMEISWQVNGNSAMTAFQIDFYLNDANSTYVTSTGRLTDNCPFYGTDRFGRPQFFTWSPNGNPTWNGWSMNKLTNGNEYKYKITQWYPYSNIYTASISGSTLIINKPYFLIEDDGALMCCVFDFKFAVSGSIRPNNFHFFYDKVRGIGWYYLNSIASDKTYVNVIYSQQIPSDGTDLGSPTVLTENYIVQYASSMFATQSSPTITLFTSDSDYVSNKTELINNSTRNTSIIYFVADYNQQQGVPISWIRWQVAIVNNGEVGEIIADTGEIYTPTLNYEFNGFFNKQQYAIRCLGESESGQERNSDWVVFNIKIENQGEYSGDFTVKCLNKENATLMEWEGVEVIPYSTGPQGYKPQISNGLVTLLPKNGDTQYSVTWNKVMDKNGDLQDMEFEPKWTAVWKGEMSNYDLRSDNIDFSGITAAQHKQQEVTLSGVTSFSGEFYESIEVSGVTGNEIENIDGSSGYVARISKTIESYKVNVKIVSASPAEPTDNVVTQKYSYDADTHILTAIILTREPNIAVNSACTIEYRECATVLSETFLQEVTNYKAIDSSNNLTNYTISKSQNGKRISAKLYTAMPDSVFIKIQCDVLEGYFAEFSQTIVGNIVEYNEIGTSVNIINYDVTQNDNVLTLKMQSSENNENVWVSLNVIYKVDSYLPEGTFFSIQSSASSNLNLSRESQDIIIKDNANLIERISCPYETKSVAVCIETSLVSVYFYAKNSLLSQSTVAISYQQQSLTSISILGGDSGVTVDSVSIYNNREKEFHISNYENPDFEPVWNDPNYDLYMTANFNGNLEGGTGTAAGSGFRVYRQEIGKNVLTPIATVPSTTTSIKDYGIVSRKAYKYLLYAYDNNGAFMSAVENERVVATCFKNYSLLVCDYDEENDEYHVRKQYLFALNLSTGSVGNNNSPTLNANFTRYPTRMPSTQNYASGTLQGLIGAIYTVPALIEQIGNYKWTAKPSTLDYFDSVDLEQELYDLSTTPYQLFLRDMKGRLRMIATNSAITMTTNIKQKQQSISISFPWVEIGDASDVTIIQTPDDYGWNNDNQVLDVSLDVDVETGELSATYPFPYNGTKFYLTGVNKETLTAKTPLGITPAQFNLSEVAKKTDDGKLTATVTVNSGEST